MPGRKEYYLGCPSRGETSQDGQNQEIAGSGPLQGSPQVMPSTEAGSLAALPALAATRTL